MDTFQILRGIARRLPPGLQTRLRDQSEAYWAAKDTQAREKRRNELLLAHQYPQYSIGPHTFAYKPDIQGRAIDTLVVGDYCSIAEGCTILLGGEHGTKQVSTYTFQLWPGGESLPDHLETKGGMTIGNDVWIGQNSLILSGATIGDGAVIGAGSVVRGRIPPYAIAIGSPCRVVMHRFKQDDISTLLKLRWWDWPHELVMDAAAILLDDGIPGLVDFARRHSLLDDRAEDRTPAV